MFQRLIGFFRRLFRSKGFRIGTRIFLWVFAAYFVYSFILFYITLRSIGVSFREALEIFFQVPLFDGAHLHATSTGLFIGIALGLIWFFNRRSKKNVPEDPAESEETENKPAEAPGAVQEEEEIIETKHYTFH